MTAHRWIVAGLVLAGALGLVSALHWTLAMRAAWLTYAPAPGGGPHALTLRASGATLELLDSASQAVLQTRPLAGAEGVLIQGAPGAVDDALTVDLGGGPLALPGGIHFDGGPGGDDTLLVTGGAPAPGSYQATGPQAGILTSGGTRVVFSNLEPVTDTALATNYTISATAGSDTINIINGGLGCSGLCFLTKVTSPSFESVAFANKLTVTVNGLAGADAFTLNNTFPGSGLSKLVLDAGGNAGDVMGITAFTLPAGTLRLTGVITVAQSGILKVSKLAVQASGQVTLGNFSNEVATVAGATTGSGALFGFASSLPTITVGSVEGLAGLSTNNGPVQIDDVTPGSTLVISQALHTAGGGINLLADHLTLNAAVNAGAGTVYVDNETFSVPILLGTKEAGALGLFQSELNRITAGRLQFGNVGSDTGGLTVTADITGTAGWNTLELFQDAPIVGVFSATLSVPNLALVTHSGQVNFQYNNFGRVSTLAGATQGGPFAFVTAGHVTIGTVAGVSGIHTAGGNLGVVAHSAGIAVGQSLFSGAGTLQLRADESAGPAESINVEAGVVVSVTANDLILWAGDQINLKPGSRVALSGAGNMFLAMSVNDTDNLGGGTFAGTIEATTHIPQASGDFADDTLLVDFSAGASLPLGLIYDAGGGLNTLIASEAGDSSPHQFSASGTGVSRDFTDLIHFSRVQNVTVIGGSGADQFGVLPDAGATLNLVGGLPGASPGDELFLNLIVGTPLNPALAITGHDATGLAGQWTFSNRQPVNFSGMDTLGNLYLKLYLPLLKK